MNATPRLLESDCFQALLGGHDELVDTLGDVATLADNLLLDASNRELMDRVYESFAHVADDVAKHIEDEERGIFPALQASGVSHDMIQLLERDHSTLRSMIREMGQLDPTSLRAPRKLAYLVHSFTDFFAWHTEREEELALVVRRDSSPPRSSRRSM